MDDLLQEFIAETRETLEAISGEIVAWEADPSDRARLDSIFRFVHTIKGSCGFLDLPRLARLSHAAEDALAAVRAGERVADAALVTAILAIIDRIAEIVEAIDAGAALDDSGEDLLLGALSAAPAAPSAAVAPIDVGVPSAAGAPVQPRRSVRLSVDLLDRMMGGVSDMVLARNQLSRRLRDLGDPSLDAVLERLSMTVAELRDTVTRTRMQRIDALFSALPRIVRDTAGTLGKQVALTIEGAEVELDREMIELLRDPLVHMVRNAIDHGIEAPSQRLLAGKPVKGTLSVSARQAGNLIVVEIADDGAGIDADALVAKLSRGDPTRAPALAALDAEARARLIFEPGLSSRDEVTSLSGRGVGMDVVRANVEQIGGRIGLRNRPGRGLVVVLEVPLTLAILNTVLVEAAGTRFALPQQAVEEIVAFDPAATRIDRIGSGAIVTVRGRRLPLADIAAIVDVGAGRAPRFVAILNLRDGAFALALDSVADTQELVVRPAAPAVMSAGLYAGQVLPDDGLPVLLLDCAGIAERAQIHFATRREEAAVVADVPPPARALIFRDADDVMRGIRVEAVERIEAIGPGALSNAAGAWWLIEAGRPVRVHAAGTLDPAAITAVLRLGPAAGALAYPVREVLDLVDLPPDLAGGADGAATVAVIDGATIEIVAPAASTIDPRPICLLSGSDGAWMESFLKPTVEGAGYRATRSLAPGERAAAVLAMEDDAPATGAIRLSRQEGAGLYRLDRAAIAAELTGRAEPTGRRA